MKILHCSFNDNHHLIIHDIQVQFYVDDNVKTSSKRLRVTLIIRNPFYIKKRLAIDAAPCVTYIKYKLHY